MSLRLHPVRSLRQVMSEIEHAISASAALSAAASKRRAAFDRGEALQTRACDL